MTCSRCQSRVAIAEGIGNGFEGPQCTTKARSLGRSLGLEGHGERPEADDSFSGSTGLVMLLRVFHRPGRSDLLKVVSIVFEW
jgi:hypothetical protein